MNLHLNCSSVGILPDCCGKKEAGPDVKANDLSVKLSFMAKFFGWKFFSFFAEDYRHWNELPQPQGQSQEIWEGAQCSHYSFMLNRDVLLCNVFRSCFWLGCLAVEVSRASLSGRRSLDKSEHRRGIVCFSWPGGCFRVCGEKLEDVLQLSEICWVCCHRDLKLDKCCFNVEWCSINTEYYTQFQSRHL